MTQKWAGNLWRQVNVAGFCKRGYSSGVNAARDGGAAALEWERIRFGRSLAVPSTSADYLIQEGFMGNSHCAGLRCSSELLNILHVSPPRIGGGMGLLGSRGFVSSALLPVAEKGEQTGTGNAKVENGPSVSSPPDVDPAGSAEGGRLRQIRGGPVSWLSLALAIATGAGILAYYENEKSKLLQHVKQGPSAGRAAIGGPFLLLDHEGKPLSHNDLCGEWNLLYFGFTNCPDICPVELTKMADAVNKLEKEYGLLVRPVFITVDPERDGVEQVRSYIKDYHARLIGLTGTTEEIKQMAKAYRVYYMKTDDEGDNYLVDHSIIMYLMDPNMEFVKFYGKNHTAESLAKGIAEEVQERKGVKVDKKVDVVEVKSEKKEKQAAVA